MKDQNQQGRVTVHLDVPEEMYLRLRTQSCREGIPLDALIFSALHQDIYGSEKMRDEVWMEKR